MERAYALSKNVCDCSPSMTDASSSRSFVWLSVALVHTRIRRLSIHRFSKINYSFVASCESPLLSFRMFRRLVQYSHVEQTSE